MKRVVASLLLLTVLMSLPILTHAAVIVPTELRASADYMSASISLGSNAICSFSAITTFQFSQIKVTNCSLQVKNEDGTWEHVCSKGPSTTKSNARTFDTEYNYSSYCTYGHTYPDVATFNADGKTITKTSNERSF